MDPHLQLKRSPPQAGLKSWTARSVGQHLANCANGAALVKMYTIKILKFGTPQTIAIIVLKIEKN